MALQIVRNNIINVSADAIVNTANPKVAVGPGVDQAIYEAAGWDCLLADREKIGEMKPGQVAYTPAYDLNAKYIIHAIGPAWRGGSYGERETVALCYSRSLALAADLGCESIAFPLMATGTYGFPKDEALKIAIREISDFLLTHEMEVLLVVYDKESFEVSGRLFTDIKSYIEEPEILLAEEQRSAYRDEVSRRQENRMEPDSLSRPLESGRLSNERNRLLDRGRRLEEERENRARKRSLFRRRSKEDSEAFESSEADSNLMGAGTPVTDEEATLSDFSILEKSKSIGSATEPQMSFPSEGKTGGYVANTMPFPTEKMSLEERLKHLDKTFQEYLFMLIDRKGFEDTEVYKRANIDRKHFSKIRSNKDYKPSKKTALALAIALELGLDETRDLLSRAGLALSPSSTFDKIVEYCIDNGEYDIYEINCVLFKYDQDTLGA